MPFASIGKAVVTNSIFFLAKADIRKLIYCVDPKNKQRLLSLFGAEHDKYKDCGVVTWEEVAGIQITLAKSIDAPLKIRSFIAGAIQYQFCQHGIIPTVLSEKYLVDEPSVIQVDEGIVSAYDHHDSQWARIKGVESKG